MPELFWSSGDERPEVESNSALIGDVYAEEADATAAAVGDPAAVGALYYGGVLYPFPNPILTFSINSAVQYQPSLRYSGLEFAASGSAVPLVVVVRSWCAVGADILTRLLALYPGGTDFELCESSVPPYSKWKYTSVTGPASHWLVLERSPRGYEIEFVFMSGDAVTYFTAPGA